MSGRVHRSRNLSIRTDDRHKSSLYGERMQRRPATLLLAPLALLAALAACASDKGFKTHDISRSDYGARWPLSSDTAVLACEPGRVPTVTVDGTSYGLDRADEGEARPAMRLNRILADDPDGEKKDPAVLLRDALALCD